MAHVEIQLNAIGGSLFAPEKCGGCDKTFRRGERMNAVVDEDGTSNGWFCGECVSKWKRGDKAFLADLEAKWEAEGEK